MLTQKSRLQNALVRMRPRRVGSGSAPAPGSDAHDFVRRRFCYHAGAALVLAPFAATAFGQGFSGAVTTRSSSPACVSRSREQSLIRARLAMYEARHGRLSQPSTDGPIAYPFYPQGGTLYRDLTTGNFVDLDPAHRCSTTSASHYGNDGHAGCDAGGRAGKRWPWACPSSQCWTARSSMRTMATRT